jgi:hypothetical protein
MDKCSEWENGFGAADIFIRHALNTSLGKSIVLRCNVQVNNPNKMIEQRKTHFILKWVGWCLATTYSPRA